LEQHKGYVRQAEKLYAVTIQKYARLQLANKLSPTLF